MTMLVSLSRAKAHLRITGTDDDSDVELKLKGASAAVLRYIDSNQDFLDTNGDPDEESDGVALNVPEDIQAATLLLLGDLYKERDGVNAAEWEHGFLPRSVVRLLYPYRTPTLA